MEMGNEGEGVSQVHSQINQVFDKRKIWKWSIMVGLQGLINRHILERFDLTHFPAGAIQMETELCV